MKGGVPIALAAVIGALSVEPAQAQSASFAGKTITLMCHTPPGGGYDAYVRLLSRHLGRFLPGNPNVIVANKPGAGGYVAANYAANAAPRDGTFVVLMQQSTLLDEPMGRSAMRLSLRDLNWVGNFSQSNNLLVTWHTSPIKTIDDARKRAAPIGASGVNSTAAQLPAFLNAILGTRFKVVHGYEGGAAINLAMERGLESVENSGALFDPGNEITSAQFQAFGERALARNPALKAVAWTPFVSGNEVPSNRACWHTRPRTAETRRCPGSSTFHRTIRAWELDGPIEIGQATRRRRTNRA